jgi:sirohydrochlorin cobaltochelatase
MTTEKTNLLVLVGHGSGDRSDLEPFEALSEKVAQHLHCAVQSALLEDINISVGEKILSAVIQHQPRHVVVMPLFVGTGPARLNTVKLIVEAAQDRWSDIAIQYAESPSLHPGVITAYTQLVIDTLAESPDPDRPTALLVIGRGSRDAQSNAESNQMAQYIANQADYSFVTVETAFAGTAQPDLSTALNHCIQAGAQRVVVVPYLLYEKILAATLRQKIQALQSQYPSLDLQFASPLSAHAGIVDAIAERYAEALIVLTRSENSGRIRSHSHAHPHIRLETMLPPRYQSGAAVSAAPMGAADLLFDANGQVAWDEMWGDFCDLALAGGPPHRGTLLEPVMAETVNADPEGYARVLAELARGLSLVTKCPIITSAVPGWIGLQCTDEAMALWLLRAIIVENVSVRREGNILYLPAGPQFRLEYEIKNVITVAAKTHHYWTEHLNSPT